MSRLSGVIETWVESMLKSTKPRFRYCERRVSRSAESFCFEYWSFLVYQLIQFGERSANRSSSSFSWNACAPTMLIERIFATSPSDTAKLMPTRLRSSGVTVVCTSAA